MFPHCVFLTVCCVWRQWIIELSAEAMWGRHIIICSPGYCRNNSARCQCILPEAWIITDNWHTGIWHAVPEFSLWMHLFILWQKRRYKEMNWITSQNHCSIVWNNDRYLKLSKFGYSDFGWNFWMHLKCTITFTRIHMPKCSVFQYILHNMLLTNKMINRKKHKWIDHCVIQPDCFGKSSINFTRKLNIPNLFWVVCHQLLASRNALQCLMQLLPKPGLKWKTSLDIFQSHLVALGSGFPGPGHNLDRSHRPGSLKAADTE